MTNLVGTVLDSVEFDVERGKVREFARATGAEDPAHVSAEAARARGHDNVLATATHVVVAGHYRDQKAFVAKLGLEMSRIVVGSVSWDHVRPLRAGDSLTGTRKVVGDDLKQRSDGSVLRLVTLETTYVDGDGDVVTRQREVLVERGAR